MRDLIEDREKIMKECITWKKEKQRKIPTEKEYSYSENNK